MILVLAKYIGVAFGGAFIASAAEKVFKYSLFDTIVGVVAKIFRKKQVAK